MRLSDVEQEDYLDVQMKLEEAEMRHLPAIRVQVRNEDAVIPRHLRFGLPVEDDLETLWWGCKMQEHPRNSQIFDHTGRDISAPPPKPLGYEGCLVRFCKLRHANPQDVLAFASRYGVLGLWPMRHDLPAGAGWVSPEGKREQSERESFFVGADHERRVVTKGFARFYGDDIEFWRRLASLTHALVQAHLAVTGSRRLPPEVWRVLLPDEPQEKTSLSEKACNGTDRSVLRAVLGMAAEAWTEAVPMHLVLKPAPYSEGTEVPYLRASFGYQEPAQAWWRPLGEDDDGVPGSNLQRQNMGGLLKFLRGHTRMGELPPPLPSPLFAALTTQLIGTLTLGDKVFECYRCGDLFTKPERMDGRRSYPPRKGTSTFCSICDPDARRKANVEKSQRSRAKMRAAAEALAQARDEM